MNWKDSWKQKNRKASLVIDNEAAGKPHEAVRNGIKAVRTRSVRTGENIRLNRDFHETPVAFELSMNSRYI